TSTTLTSLCTCRPGAASRATCPSRSRCSAPLTWPRRKSWSPLTSTRMPSSCVRPSSASAAWTRAATYCGASIACLLAPCRACPAKNRSNGTKELDDRPFHFPVGGELARVHARSQLGQGVTDRPARLVRADHPRIHVRGPRHGGGVAQIFGDLPHDPGDRPLPGRVGLGHTRDGQPDGGQHGGVPGAEVLGGELADGLAQ